MPQLLMSITIGIAIRALVLLPLFYLHVLSRAQASMAPMEETEQQNLYSVIQGFAGTSWDGLGLYPDPCGWTPIQGISCDFYDGLWYVTEMNIGPVLDNSLECTPDAKFSPLLFELKHVKTLSFFNCFSSLHQPITIPSQNWEKLAGSLETLEFRSNRGLIGEIPAGLGQLANLQSLVLVVNALAGELPQELGKLNHLRRLVLGGNQFSGRIPASLGYNLSELLILDLSRNSLSGPIPSSLGGMSALLKLDLSNNLLNGKLPIELGKLRNLTLLDLRNNNFTGGLPQSLEGMVLIQDMLLSSNPLGGSITDFGWENLSNLTNLDLGNMGLSGSIPESITMLKRLRYLALDNNHFSGTVPPKLAALPCLTGLYLNGNNLAGELGFSEEFYERMGRRFASWNNTNLCYTAGVVHIPFGLEQCKQEQELSTYAFDPQDKTGGWSPDQNSSIKAFFGLSPNPVKGCWWVVLMQELMLVFLLVVLL